MAEQNKFLKPVADYVDTMYSSGELIAMEKKLPSFTFSKENFLDSCKEYVEERMKFYYQQGKLTSEPNMAKNIAANFAGKLPSFNAVKLSSLLEQDKNNVNNLDHNKVYNSERSQFFHQVLEKIEKSLPLSAGFSAVETFQQGRQRLFQQAVMHEVMEIATQQKEYDLGMRRDVKDSTKLIATMIVLERTEPELSKQIFHALQTSQYGHLALTIRQGITMPTVEIAKEVAQFAPAVLIEGYPTIAQNLGIDPANIGRNKQAVNVNSSPSRKDRYQDREGFTVGRKSNTEGVLSAKISAVREFFQDKLGNVSNNNNINNNEIKNKPSDEWQLVEMDKPKNKNKM